MQRHCVSAVVPARHDNWGGGLALRAQTTLPHLAAAFDELLLVDFNSQNGTLLSTLALPLLPRLRSVVVDRSLYHATLRSFCEGIQWSLALGVEKRLDACAASFFAGVCPAERPYPCLTGCSAGYRECARLAPSDVVPGYFHRNVHVVKHAARFALYHPV